MNNGKWTVIGAGNGGQTAAGHLGMMGYEVAVYDVLQKTVTELNQAGGIELSGAIEGFGSISFATTDIEKALAFSNRIMITLPAIYLPEISLKCAPYLTDEHKVILHPGSTFGPLAFRQGTRRAGCTASYLLGGTSTLLYACRLIKNGKVNVFGVKEKISAAALPATENEKLHGVMGDVYPQLEYISSVIEVGLDNLNAIVHPAPALLNVARMESGEEFEYYLDGFTPTVAKFAEQIDHERLRIGRAIGIELLDVCRSYQKEYSIDKDNLFDVIHACTAYTGLMAPHDIHNRYFLEDVPFTLVPFQSLARFAGVETPGIDAIITISKMLFGSEMAEGYTDKLLGFDNFRTKEELLQFVIGNESS